MSLELIRRAFVLICCLFCIYFPSFSVGFQHGDRVMAVAMSQHMDTRTTWNDMALQIVPRFMVDESVVYHAPIPKYNVNATDYKINVKSDFKVTLSFDYNKFAIPWVTIFDAAQRRVLRRMKLTFTHDRYEILKVDYELIYGNRIAYIDPTHPSLRGFEIHYHWENVEEEDFPAGIQTLLISTFLGFFIIVAVVMMYIDFGDKPVQSSTGSGKRTTSSKAAAANVRSAYR